MVEKAGYRISDIYQGGYSGLIPPSNNYISSGSLSMTTDPRSANILQEVSSKLSMGVKNIEVTAISPEVFDEMPKQHLKEVNRLAKLTGVDISLHGPLIEASGVSQNGFSEAERESAERKIANALLRSHELNPNGNIPVTFHSAVSIPGSQPLPEKERKQGEEYKRMIVVNKETGRLAPLESEKRFVPAKEGIKKEVYSPEENLRIMNHTEWDNNLSQIEFNRQRVDEILKENGDDPVARGLYINWVVAQQNPDAISKEALEEIKNLSPKQWDQIKKIHAAATYADQAIKSAMSVFDKAVKNVTTEEEKKLLEETSKEYRKILGANENGKIELSRALDPKTQSEALFTLIKNLERVQPQSWVPIEKFAVEKSSQTYGRAAYEAYKKFKDKAPIMVIENPPAGGGLSTGEDIKNIVVESRKQFVQNAVKEGISKSEAERQAEKHIGATWDVGHINMLRGFGYTEKEIIAETEKVAPYVKHVHLSDNFGFEHTELPMGMGNVPLKEMMEKLGEKGFEAKKVIEAAGWWKHFKTPPFQETLEAVGSPLYSMYMAPYWSQAAGLYQGYSSGYGQMLPQINYETFGAGFSKLPAELGGSVQGAQGGRMSGRPME